MLSPKMCNPVSTYKNITYAHKLGMDILALDDPDRASFKAGEGYDPISIHGIGMRNAHMAHIIAQAVKEGKKIVCIVGCKHLYDLPRYTTQFTPRINSLQHILRDRSIVTYSAALLSNAHDVDTEANHELMAAVDAYAAQKIARDFRANKEEMQDTQIVDLMLGLHTEWAGKKVPDRWIVFSETGCDWWRSIQGNDIGNIPMQDYFARTISRASRKEAFRPR